MRFGRTKGEILVDKGDFQGDFLLLRVWSLFGNQPPHPPTFGKNFSKNTFFFWFFFGGGGSPNTSYGIILLFGVWHLQSGGSVGSSKKSGPNEKWGGVCLELIN